MNAEIEVVQDAIILSNGFGSNKIFETGVFDRNGDPVERAIHKSASYRRYMPKYQSGEIIQSGRALFGGFLFDPHFGHILVESLGRLWAVEHLSEQVEEIVFLPGFGASRSVPDFFRDLMGLLGINHKCRILEKSERFSTLYVPEQLFGLGNLIRPHQNFVDFSRKLLSSSSNVGANMIEKVYVSRSSYGVRQGGLACEPLLEENLKKQGYEVVYPEKLSIKEQVDIYKNARVILFSEGSSIHFYGLIAQEEQQVGLIVTRHEGEIFRRQIEGFCGRSPSLIQCIDGYWIPENHPYPLVNSTTILNFDLLKEELSSHGFIDSGAEWIAPSETAVRECVAEFSDAYHGNIFWRKRTDSFPQPPKE